MKYLKITAVMLMALMLIMPLPAKAQDNPLAGYTIGLNVGYPILAGDTYASGTGPVIGIVGNTPYGFALGPFNIGVGFGVEAVMMELKTQVGVVATLNTTLYTTPYGPLSYWGGVGYYDGIGAIGGLYFDYMVPNMPLVIKPYGRAVINTGGGADGKSLTGYANIGVMFSYDISTLF